MYFHGKRTDLQFDYFFLQHSKELMMLVLWAVEMQEDVHPQSSLDFDPL